MKMKMDTNALAGLDIVDDECLLRITPFNPAFGPKDCILLEFCARVNEELLFAGQARFRNLRQLADLLLDDAVQVKLDKNTQEHGRFSQMLSELKFAAEKPKTIIVDGVIYTQEGSK